MVTGGRALQEAGVGRLQDRAGRASHFLVHDVPAAVKRPECRGQLSGAFQSKDQNRPGTLGQDVVLQSGGCPCHGGFGYPLGAGRLGRQDFCLHHARSVH
ncbi:hypothetical protein D9M72_315680 [compost metagenome]